MSSEWSRHTLEVAPVSILDGDRGTNYPSQDEFLSAGHCLFLNTGNVTTGGFNFSNCAFISAEKDNVLRKGKLVRGDIVLTTRGTVGNVGLFNERIPFDHVRINSGMVILRPDQETLSSYFLYLFLRSDLFKEQANALRSGSAQPQLPIRDLKCVEITVPPIEDQNKICSFLGALDDRIALLRETNTTLEAIAQALFKSWFVDFDPVRAKQEGREPEGMDADTAALFPASFEESELGLVPKGWRVGQFGDILTLRNERTKPSNETASLPYVPTEIISSKLPFLESFKNGDEANSSLILFHQGDILFGAMRPYFHKVCIAPFKGVTRTTVFTLKPKNAKAVGYSLFQAYQGSTVEYATLHSEGSTIPYAKWANSLEKMPLIVPPQSLQEAFSDVVGGFIQKANEGVKQAQTLAILRDALLPRLISGQLRLPDAEALVEAVTV